MAITRNGAVRSVNSAGTHISNMTRGSKGKEAIKRKSGGVTPAHTSFLDSDPALPCRVCERMVSEEKAIMCDRCQGWVHLKCTDLTEADYTMLSKITSQSVKWHCSKCEKAPKNTPTEEQLAANEAKIGTLTEVVRTIQDQNQAILRVLEGQKAHQEADIKKAVKEYLDEAKEREDRANNIVLFNIPEPAGSGEEALREDQNIVQKVLEEICGEESADVIENINGVKRLGKPPAEGESTRRPRPVKVAFKNLKSRKNVTTNARKLRHSRNFSQIGVSTDKTLAERERDRKLLAEVRERRGRGERVTLRDGQIVTTTPGTIEKNQPAKENDKTDNGTAEAEGAPQ